MPAPSHITRNPITLWAAWTAACALLIIAAGSIGKGPSPGNLLVSVIGEHLLSGWPAILFLLAAIGFGRWITRFTKHRFGISIRLIAPAVGLGFMLALIVVLGTLGLLGFLVSVAITAIGIAGIAFDWRTNPPRKISPPPGWLWLGLPGIAILALASASPPGTLWSSEYGGYDVLSYHLQLPKEWIALGNTRPAFHNVYSFLPGALEQAFAFLGWMSGAGSDGLLASGGWRLSSAQTLHAGLTLMCALLVACLTRRLAIAAGCPASGARTASTIAGGLVLCTPWSIVVGSMAYNEMAMLVLGAAALLAALRRNSNPIVRGLLVGALVGAACLVKPTALLFVGAPAGILMLRFGKLADWSRLIAGALVAGLVLLSPWLVRNAVMTGNPVFPLATGIFGTGHWSPQQTSTWSDAHTFVGSISDRFRLLIFADPSAQDGANAVARYRGISNTQWLLAFPAAVVAGLGLLVWKRSRAVGIGLVMCLSAQLIAWLGFTHLQSRFLIPCLIVIGPLVGIGAGIVRTPRRLGAGLGIALVLLQGAALWTIFAEQRRGQPNALVGAGPGLFLGDPYQPELGRALPQAYLNHEVPADSPVLFIGGAAPLYYKNRIIYATVWDSPPVFGLIEGKMPEIEYVLIDDGELFRQHTSGYLDHRITPVVLETLTSGLMLVRTWPNMGVRLYRVNPDSPKPEPKP